MKKINYVIILFISILLMPKVYASFTYDIVMEVNDTEVEKGSLKEIKVSLDNISGENQGIGVCVMNISFDNNITLDSQIRTLNSWTMTTGERYLFDTGNVATAKTAMFVIPVKVNGSGAVKLYGIHCSDGVDEIKTADKEINFTILDNTQHNNQENENNSNQNNSDNNNNNNETEEIVEDSNANLSNIILSEGTIDFDPNITEYSIEISDFNKLEITPVLESTKAQSVIDRNILEDSNSIVITVSAENGDTKVYTIYVKEISNNEVPKNKNTYVPIFIGIICVLVIINIVRIIKNRKK